MENLIPILSGMRRELEALTKKVALINKSQSQQLTESWCRKKDACKILGISARCLDQLTSSGAIPISKINGLIYIKVHDIQRLLDDHYDIGSSANSSSTLNPKSNV